MTPALLSAALLLLLLLPGAPAQNITINFKVNKGDQPNMKWTGRSGINLLDMMKTNQGSDSNFTFGWDENCAPFLKVVDEKARNNENYWDVEVKKPGSLTYSSVSLGCYIPKDKDTILVTLKKKN